MSEYDDSFWYGDDQHELYERSARQLIERHREEYEEIVGSTLKRRIERLEKELADKKVEIANLRALNPEGVYAPALTHTVNRLMELQPRR